MKKIWAGLFVALCVTSASVDTPSPMPPSATYEVGFSPYGNSRHLLLSAIKEAKHTILVAAYSFTSRPIAAALAEARQRGVKVRVVADAKSNKGNYSATQYLANQKVPVRLNARYAIHHHKFMVIDDSTVETGSFNFTTAAAGKNAENVIILRGVPQVAKVYTEEWKRLWDESEDLPAAY